MTHPEKQFTLLDDCSGLSGTHIRHGVQLRGPELQLPLPPGDVIVGCYYQKWAQSVTLQQKHFSLVIKSSRGMKYTK